MHNPPKFKEYCHLNHDYPISNHIHDGPVSYQEDDYSSDSSLIAYQMSRRSNSDTLKQPQLITSSSSISTAHSEQLAELQYPCNSSTSKASSEVSLKEDIQISENYTKKYYENNFISKNKKYGTVAEKVVGYRPSTNSDFNSYYDCASLDMSVAGDSETIDCPFKVAELTILRPSLTGTSIPGDFVEEDHDSLNESARLDTSFEEWEKLIHRKSPTDGTSILADDSTPSSASLFSIPEVDEITGLVDGTRSDCSRVYDSDCSTFDHERFDDIDRLLRDVINGDEKLRQRSKDGGVGEVSRADNNTSASENSTRNRNRSSFTRRKLD